MMLGHGLYTHRRSPAASARPALLLKHYRLKGLASCVSGLNAAASAALQTIIVDLLRKPQ